MSEFSEKIKTIGVIGSRPRKHEVTGREHPDSGKPFRSVTDETGNVVTEHSEPGSGVSFRQDVEIRPSVVEADFGGSL